MNRPRSLEHWDRGFESYSRYGFVCVNSVFVLSSGLVTGWSLVQGVLPTVYRIKKLK
jgi:hypothetical protein